MGKDTVSVSTGGEVESGDVVANAALGEPGGIGVVFGGGSLSSVTIFVVANVDAVVATVTAMVLSVTADVSEIEARLEAVTVGVTAAECVVASGVSLVECVTIERGLLLVVLVGPTMEVVSGAAGAVGCRVAAVVVTIGSGESVVLVEEVTQNRAVMANGAMLVLEVLRLEG